MSTKEELIYEQQSNDVRALNTFFWQIPLIMMTLNGGLWFSVASLELDHTTQRGILWFAAAANVIMAFALTRVRDIMGELLTETRKFEGRPAPETERVVVRLFCFMLLAAALGAILASCTPGDRFLKASNAAKAAAISAAKQDGAVNATAAPPPPS